MPDLILALDITEKKKALAVAHACAPYLDAIKIGYPLVLSAGLGIAGELARRGPAAHRRLQGRRYPEHEPAHLRAGLRCRFLRDHLPWFSRHGLSESLRGLRPCAPRGVLRGRRDEPPGRDGILFRRCCRADRLGCHHFRSRRDRRAGHRPDRVRVLRGFVGDRKILSPGIGTQGGDVNAVAALVDGIIVGRSIYEAPDPVAAAQSYAISAGTKKPEQILF